MELSAQENTTTKPQDTHPQLFCIYPLAQSAAPLDTLE